MNLSEEGQSPEPETNRLKQQLKNANLILLNPETTEETNNLRNETSNFG